MSCDVSKATEGFGEEAETKVKRRKGWKMRCDVGEATEGLGNEL